MTFTKSKIFDLLIFIFFTFSAIMLATSKIYSNAVLEGLNLWIACVIPALFPYLFITSILSTLKTTKKISSFFTPFFQKTFSLSGEIFYAFILSFISGYPVGAKTIADLKTTNSISSNDAIKGAILCSSPSPIFLISSVGGIMFHSTLFGVLILICNTLSTLIVGVIFSITYREKPYQHTPKPRPFSSNNFICESVFSAINSILFVGGLITLFYVFSEMLSKTGILTPTNKLFGFLLGDYEKGEALSFALLESTKGLKLLSKTSFSLLTLPLVSSITGFGGLSVIMQSTVFLKSAKIKTAPFILSKIISAVVNFILGLVISLIFFDKCF